jgi:molecular chaperone GrpE
MCEKQEVNGQGAPADETAAEVAVPEVEVTEESQESLDAAQKEAEELLVRLQRLQADFANFKRRSQGEREELSLFVAADLTRKFLPVADSLERALAAQEQDAESLRKGLELIYRQMQKSLQDAGAEKIPALGEMFSPDSHEALMNGQNPELPDGQIDMVFEEGYRIKGKVIRHSKVRVVNNNS